jgi:hypothetical protein
MATFQLIVDTAVRGYHIYRDIWHPETGESFICRQESDNEHDRYAVAVHMNENESQIVGHLPRELSKVCWYTFCSTTVPLLGKLKADVVTAMRKEVWKFHVK